MLVADNEGPEDGSSLTSKEGATDGLSVTAREGIFVGWIEGVDDCALEGLLDGTVVTFSVGA